MFYLRLKQINLLSGFFQLMSFSMIYLKGLGIGAEMLKRLSQVCITFSIGILYVIIFFIKYYLTGCKLDNLSHLLNKTSKSLFFIPIKIDLQIR